MFGGMAHKIGILAKKSAGGGGGGDVTPNAIAWETSLYDINPKTSHAVVSGINTSINIFYTLVANDGGDIYYSKNSGIYTILAENTNVSISNNDTLSWEFRGSTFGCVCIIDVKNASDGNVILKTITFEHNI